MAHIPKKNIQLIVQKLLGEIKNWGSGVRMLVSADDFNEIIQDMILEEISVQQYLNEEVDEVFKEFVKKDPQVDPEKSRQIIKKQIIKDQNLVLMTNNDEDNIFISLEKQRDIGLQVFSTCVQSKLLGVDKRDMDDARLKCVRFFEKELGRFEEVAQSIQKSLEQMDPYTQEYRLAFERQWRNKFPDNA